jgi:hypothetical protein
MKLEYRMSSEADEAALVQFWSDHGGWDRVNAAAWTHRLMRPPFGKAAIVIAFAPDTGEIRGQFAFIPSKISLNGTEVAAVRPFAPILHKDQRVSLLGTVVNPLRHPALAMYQFGVDQLRVSGIGVLYMLPDPSWIRLLRMFPRFQNGSFPLFSRPVPLANPIPLDRAYRVVQVTLSGAEVDRLFALSVKLHGCQMVRDSRSLPWKIGGGDYEIIGVEHSEKLVGLVASRLKGDRQWLICDLLVADAGTSLRATLAAVCNLAHERAQTATPDQPIQKVAILATPVLEPILREVGFARDEYDFHLLVEILNPVVDKADVAPERWYLSAND